jgi:hypothetical protein
VRFFCCGNFALDNCFADHIIFFGVVISDFFGCIFDLKEEGVFIVLEELLSLESLSLLFIVLFFIFFVL